MVSFHKRINNKVCRYYDCFLFSSCVSFVKSIFVCETYSICFFFFLLSVVFFFLCWCYINLVSTLFLGTTSLSRRSPGKAKPLLLKCLLDGMKRHFQLCYLITVWRIFTTPTNSGCFIDVYQTNSISWKQSNVQVVNTAKSRSLVWQLPMPLAINCLHLLLVKQKIQGVLKTLRNFPVDIDHKERAGWIVLYLKNGWEM